MCIPDSVCWFGSAPLTLDGALGYISESESGLESLS